MGIADTLKGYYNTNLTNKINSSVEEAKKIPLGLDENVRRMKKTFDEYSRKDINLSFIDRFTRMLYTNPYHLVKLEFIQYIIFVVLIYYYNPLSISTKYPAYTKLLVLIVAFAYVILFMFIKMKMDEKSDVDLIEPTESNVVIQIISIIVFFILFMFVIKGVVWLLINTSIITAIRHMLGLFIALGVLGIVYLVMKKTINKARSAPGRKFTTLLLKVVMYLPCLFVDIVEYVKYQLNLTTKPVWIILGVEAALIGLYYVVPFLFDKLMTANGTKLLNQPIYLSTEITLRHYINVDTQKLSAINRLYTSFDEANSDSINSMAQEDIDLSNNRMKGDYKDPNMPKNQVLAWFYKNFKTAKWLKVDLMRHPQYKDTSEQRFRYSYALSGWFYINPQPPNTRSAYNKYTNILKYGNKIKIEFNGQLGSLRVMGDVASSNSSGSSGSSGSSDSSGNYNYNINNNNESVEIYETKNVLYQKWNNVVVNYEDGYMDVFLNGDLVGSLSGVAPYMTFDNIIAGENGGLSGGICNVAYYDKPLSKSNISLTYKSLSGKEVPYIWSIKDEFSVNVQGTGTNKQFLDEVKNMVGLGS
jgi:hypothetical protein